MVLVLHRNGRPAVDENLSQAGSRPARGGAGMDDGTNYPVLESERLPSRFDSRSSRSQPRRSHATQPRNRMGARSAPPRADFVAAANRPRATAAPRRAGQPPTWPPPARAPGRGGCRPAVPAPARNQAPRSPATPDRRCRSARRARAARASVSSVALTRPPMTTVASGFCTSAPVPVASAIGTKPSEATSAVMSTGRSRVSAPSQIASSRPQPLAAQLVDEGQHDEAVQHRDAGERDEADRGRDRERHAAQPERERCRRSAPAARR